jgi:hypothetical protein
MNADAGRSVNTHPNLITFYAQYGDGYVVTDHESLTNSSGQYQHLTRSLTIDRPSLSHHLQSLPFIYCFQFPAGPRQLTREALMLTDDNTMTVLQQQWSLLETFQVHATGLDATISGLAMPAGPHAAPSGAGQGKPCARREQLIEQLAPL